MKIGRLIAVMFAATAVVSAAKPPSTHIRYTASLAGTDEAPSNTTVGKGKVEAVLDTTTGVLTYKATYAGLTGPATMAHFHGPAAAGGSAPPIFGTTSVAGPVKGTQTLTSDQVASLEAGQWYFNVHTQAHPSGEIRGQLTAR